MIPRVLSIAGSDSGGGAGIQADLKAFAACGVHGMTAVTAITAQSTIGVRAVHHVPAELIVEQVAAVAQDIGVDAVKIGMLGTEQTIAAVLVALEMLPAGTPVVLDPVMVAESGATLLEDGARAALVAELLPRATVITPNLHEAHALADAAGDPAGRSRLRRGPSASDSDSDLAATAQTLRALGPPVVVITGGHRRNATDLYWDGKRLIEIPGERFEGGAAHGSGCTHSSVLAARLAWGEDPLSAARAAKAAAARAVRLGLRSIGAGAGPVDVLGVTGRRPGGDQAFDAVP